MFLNYIKVAIRNMLRYRAYSITNIAGLAIGITCCLFIVLYIHDELSYDRFYENYDRIYRVYEEGKLGEEGFRSANTPSPLSQTLQDYFGKFLTPTRIYKGINTVITYNEVSHFESRYLYADTNFFRIFPNRLIKGDISRAFSEPGTMVITESLADRYFGEENPIGKILHEADGNDFVVTAVVADLPVNSHFQYDILASMNTVNWRNEMNWLNSNLFYTYILLREDVPLDLLKNKMNALISAKMIPELEHTLGISRNVWEQSGNHFRFDLEPLGRIYLFSDLSDQIGVLGDIRYVYFFSALAIFILLLAFINFTSLTTAKSSTRARELGMRKVLGSQRTELIRQMLTESVAITFVAFLVAMMLVELLMPGFNQLTGKQLDLNVFARWYLVPAMIILVVIVGVLAGSYSSYSLSSMGIVQVIKVSQGGKERIAWYRSGLVIFQFIIAVIIIISTLVIYSQLLFVNRSKLGFDEDHVVVVDRAYGLEQKVFEFRDVVNDLAGVNSASVMMSVPGKEGWFNVMLYNGISDSADLVPFRLLAGDLNMMKSMGYEMVKGRYFDPEKKEDANTLIINETAARSLGFEDPLGCHLYARDPRTRGRMPLQIIGIMKDFHYRPLYEKIENVVMTYPERFFPRYIAARIDPSSMDQTLKMIEKIWYKLSSNQPYSYFFLDQTIDELYRTEKRTARIFTVFSILAFIIASMGMVGLASFLSEQRTREIGIRKAMGANRTNIVVIFAREFVQWVLLANIISWPLAYFLMNTWLENFAYRISFPWWVTILTLVLTMVFSLVTVSYQTFLAAMKKPAESIRYE